MDGGAGRNEGLVGLTLRTVLGKQKDRPVRTLLDIIRQEEPNCRAYGNLIEHHENKKGWKFFKNRLNLNKQRWDGDVRGAGARGSDDVHPDLVVSASNVMGRDSGSENSQRQPLAQLLRARSVQIVEPVWEDDDSGEVPWAPTAQVQLRSHSLPGVASSRQNEVDGEPVRVSDVSVPNMNNQLQSPLIGLTDEPVRSVRLSEALAAEREHMQIVISSTEAPRSAQDEDVTETHNDDVERGEIGSGRESAIDQPQQPRMSLMDLLDETDMLVSRSSYIGDVYDHNENSDEGNEDGVEEGTNAVGQNCCVCMVRHKGSAFIPCGHTFCRLCSRELWVKRGNCPICNGFILEILDIF